MSASEATPSPPGDVSFTVDDATNITSEPGADLTISEATVAFRAGRRLIRTKLYAGEFPNAAKDANGSWHIPEADLVAAGLRRASDEPTVPADDCADDRADVTLPDELDAPVETAAKAGATEPVLAAETAGTPDMAETTADAEALKLLRLEVLDLQHRLERSEALLEAERRLSEERGRALDAERATVEALYRQSGIARPAPKAPEPPRVDWQASMRAARERDLQQRAARDQEARRREVHSEARAATPAPAPAPAPASNERAAEVATPAPAAATDTTNGPATVDAPDAHHEPERRHRWRRR